ncbi:MAG: late competence development ComFB family protein [Lachnospiraceae bacterium]|nr:late competence development ComFB family protein [Lachnospiraceae bacterium]
MKLILRNLTEDYVIIKIEEILQNFNCCKCEQCRLDIASYALNRLQPRYVATSQGALMTKLCEFSGQFEVSTTAIIVQAIETISKNPHHPAVE